MNDDIQNDSPEESFAELFESYSGGMNQDIQIGEKIRADQAAWLAYCGAANPEDSSKQDLISAELCR